MVRMTKRRGAGAGSATASGSRRGGVFLQALSPGHSGTAPRTGPQAGRGSIVLGSERLDVGQDRAAKGQAVVPLGCGSIIGLEPGAARAAGQAPGRCCAKGRRRAGDGSLPGLAAAGVIEAEPGQDAGPHQRGLAAAGSTVNHHEVLPASRAMTSSVIGSRPKKIGARPANGRRPG